MKAEYVDHMGTDLTVVNSARVSFDKASEWLYVNVLKPEDKKLIQYLAKHKHFTPFTHPQITIRETVPIFVARQRFKHTVGFTYNEVSRRYVDDSPVFFYPEEWRSRPDKSIKQGSGQPIQHNIYIKDIYEKAMYFALKTYEEMLNTGVAPEQARMVLPQSMFTSYYVTGSLSAFARAFIQRTDSHAQMEIQELAKQWDSVIAPLFPYSWSVLTQS